MKLSVVAVGRNDDYGGDFRERLQAFVSWTVRRLKKVEINSELIFVNYNPVAENEPIESFISWPTSDAVVQVRVITVSSQLHETFIDQTGVKPVPVLEYLAKNVGVRRAKGNFILVMNPDILLGSELFPSFKNLRSDSYYRVNRIDFKGVEFNTEGACPSEQLKETAFKIWFKGQEISIKGFSWFNYRLQWFRISASNTWRSATIYMRPFLDFLSIPVYYDRIEYQYHCNASGDFMLMARSQWMELGGYDQYSWISLHVDSMMVLRAAANGLKEHTFGTPIFHKEHERRYDAKVSGMSDQETANMEFRKKIETLLQAKETHSGNLPDWGLANANLPEITM